MGREREDRLPPTPPPPPHAYTPPTTHTHHSNMTTTTAVREQGYHRRPRLAAAAAMALLCSSLPLAARAEDPLINVYMRGSADRVRACVRAGVYVCFSKG
jgi:hypothetical protein